MNFLARHFLPSFLTLLILIGGIGYFTVINPIELSNDGEPNVLSQMFESKKGDLEILESDKEIYVQYVYWYLDRMFDKADDKYFNVPELEGYDSIYLTFLNNGSVRCSQKGWFDISEPERTRKDLEEAVERCVNDKRFGGVISKTELDDIKIVFDVSYNKKLAPTSFKDLEDEIELGIHSLELYLDGQREAFFKASVPITKRYTLEKTLEQLCKKGDLDENCYSDPRAEIYQFDDLQFLAIRDQKPVNLYRYNVLIDPAEIDNELIQARLELIPDWLLNNVKLSTGMLEYRYFPNDNSYSTDQNHTRQLATAWAISRLQDFLGIDSLDSIIKSTLDYYIDLSRCNDDYCYIWEEGESKLCYNAFILMTLLEFDKFPDTEKWIQKLADGILAQQNGDGSYQTYFNSSKNTGVDYYPGEAMLALMKVYQATGEEKYLKSVEKGFEYYRDYWRDNKNTSFIPWHTQANYLLFQETGKTEVADFVFEMIDWILDHHFITKSRYPDQIGGFPKKDPRLNTSTQTEGINDAYLLARLIGDKKHEKKYLEAIQLSVPFILNTQFTEESAFYVVNSKRTVGGFKFSLTANDQRIDYTQHALMALIKTIENNIYQ